MGGQTSVFMPKSVTWVSGLLFYEGYSSGGVKNI